MTSQLNVFVSHNSEKYTVVAKIIRTLVFHQLQKKFKSVIYILL